MTISEEVTDWESALEMELGLMWPVDEMDPHVMLEDRFDALVVAVECDDVQAEDFETIGYAAILAAQHAGVNFPSQERFAAILAGKQHDYGHGNIAKFGIQGVVVRLSDKLERLKNLRKRPLDLAVNEPLVDTYVDIAGYAAIGMMLCDGVFMLPLKADKQLQKHSTLTTDLASVTYSGTY